MSEIIGAIYPIPIDLVDRFFLKKAKVFVKFLTHNSTKLVPKNKVIFYASHGSKKLIGEGIIEKIEFLTPEKVFAKYKNTLFLNENEFFSYVGKSPSRISKEILTLTLKNIRKYSTPIEYNKKITMAGQYITTEEYKSLILRKEV